MQNWMIQLVFLIVGAALGCLGTIIIIPYQERCKAISVFRTAFIDEILALKDPNNGIRKYISKGLHDAEPKHLRAIEILLPYLGKRGRTKIKQTYNQYRNPGKIEESEFEHNLSLSFYDLDKNKIKQLIGRDISGLELVIENLDKIINAVK